KEVIGGRFGPGGAHIRLEKPRRVGVLAGGLSDGVSLHQAGGSVLIRGKRVPVLGPVFLEHTSVDLDACPEAAAGDEALILGRQGHEEIGLEELLQRWNRTLEEFWTALPAGLTRVYFENGAPVAVGRGEQVEWLERAAPSENGKTLRRM
ncbi:MAG: hypothetical protein LBR29_10415, partial [Methylobacteriaceae bacterium]|nr:hypothetical protein [Methylobacteriaceae bacterium]